MKKVEINVYSYGELSAEAKERARKYYNRNQPYWMDKELNDVIEAFEEAFYVDVKYEVSPYSAKAKVYPNGFYDHDELYQLSGNRARAWFWNNRGDLIIRPRTRFYAKKDGKWNLAVTKNSVKKESAVFFKRVIDGISPWTGSFLDTETLEPLARFCLGLKWDDKQKKYVQARYDRMTDNCYTVETVLDECVRALMRVVQKDWEYQLSEECFAETCEANEFMFYETGRMFHG